MTSKKTERYQTDQGRHIVTLTLLTYLKCVQNVNVHPTLIVLLMSWTRRMSGVILVDVVN